MADIIDRLITRFEFVGVSDAITSMRRFGAAQDTVAMQSKKITAASEATVAALNRVNQTQNRLTGLSNLYDKLESGRVSVSRGGPALSYADQAKNAQIDMKQLQITNASATAFAQQESALKKTAAAQKILNAENAEFNAILEKRRAMRATLGAAGGIIAAFLAIDLVKAATETSIKFENMRTSLAVLYRDAGRGQQAFDWIIKFAKETPFSIESATQAFIRLTSLGIAPTRRNLMILGGLGRMFHRDFEDVAMAAGIGASGNFSRLIRGFGIRREDVARNAPPGAIPLTGAVPASMRPVVFEAILKTIEQKFPQAFEAFANTTETARSNFYDSIQQILASFARLIFGSDSLKQTFDSLTTLAGFVNNVIKVFDMLKNIFLAGILAIEYMIARGLMHLTVNPARRKFWENAADLAGKASEEATRKWMTTLVGMSKYANSGEPPKPPLGQMGLGDNASIANQFIRQVVGQSGIATIGVNASELPGMQGNPMRRQPLLVKIEGSDGSDFMKFMEDAFNKLLFDANRHGYNLEPAGAR